jgi:hypothetical protein
VILEVKISLWTANCKAKTHCKTGRVKEPSAKQNHKVKRIVKIGLVKESLAKQVKKRKNKSALRNFSIKRIAKTRGKIGRVKEA